MLTWSIPASSDVIEWEVQDQGLATATSQALLRYYDIIRHDSVSMRYIISTPLPSALLLRAQTTANDERGRLLMLGYGQLQLYSTDDIRIALGEDLYGDLLESRRDPESVSVPISLGDRFGHNDWVGDHRIIWSLFDRLDLRIDQRMNLFVGLGAPESGRDFWSDGTGRVGLAHPTGELALLFPFSSGSVGLGSWFTGRLLSPGIGGVISLRAGKATGHVRYTVPYEGTLSATRPVDDAWVPTVSMAIGYRVFSVGTDLAEISVTPDVSFEEVARIFDGGGRGLIRSGEIRRLAPGGMISIESLDETLRLEVGLYNLGVRAIATARLSSAVWMEFRMMHNDLIREPDPFESPVQLFLTPRVKF